MFTAAPTTPKWCLTCECHFLFGGGRDHPAENLCPCDSEDPHRVLDYRGGPLMAVGSKDRAVHLLSLGSETKVLRVMKGHVGIIRDVLLCEERDLAITASSDASIR